MRASNSLRDSCCSTQEETTHSIRNETSGQIHKKSEQDLQTPSYSLVPSHQRLPFSRSRAKPEPWSPNVKDLLCWRIIILLGRDDRHDRPRMPGFRNQLFTVSRLAGLSPHGPHLECSKRSRALCQFRSHSQIATHLVNSSCC